MELPQFLQFSRKRKGAVANSDGVVTKLPGATTVADAAPPRMAPAVRLDPEAAPVAPEPIPHVEAPAPAAPEVSAAERRPMGSAPLARNARGETVGRPEYDDTGERGADLENYRQGLANQRNPEDRDGRLKTFFKEFGQGLLDGGLFGGVARGIRGAVSPNVNERRERDREIQRVTGEQAQVRAQDEWFTKMQDARAGVEVQRANAGWLRARPGIEAKEAETRLEIAKEATERAKSVAEMNNTGRKEVANINAGSRERVAKMLDDFRHTKLFKDLEQKVLDRKSKEGIAARAEEGRNSRAASAQAGANSRAQMAENGRNARSLAGQRFKLSNLALQAEKEGSSLEKLVNEVLTLKGEIDPEQ